jgi:hypothetical protein
MKWYALRFEVDRRAYIGSCMSDIGDLSSKGTRLNGTDLLRGGEIVVKAQVPRSEL